MLLGTSEIESVIPYSNKVLICRLVFHAVACWL